MCVQVQNSVFSDVVLLRFGPFSMLAWVFFFSALMKRFIYIRGICSEYILSILFVFEPCAAYDEARCKN